MKSNNLLALLLSILATTGCMQRQTVPPQGGTPGEVGPTPTAASPPPNAALPPTQLVRADKLIGEPVLTSEHLPAGKLRDLVLDQDSERILYAIVGIGGVLGVGELRVAVPPGQFVGATNGAVQLAVDKHKLTRAPQAPSDPGEPPELSFLNNLYGYYGQIANWQASPGATTNSFSSARTVSQLIGMEVLDHAHQALGKVETVMLNLPAGREVYVVLSPDARLNLGNQDYALPPGVLKLSTDRQTLVADLTREKLANAPHLARDNWSEISDPAWARKVYQYYGQSASWSNPRLEPTGRTGK